MLYIYLSILIPEGSRGIGGRVGSYGFVSMSKGLLLWESFDKPEPEPEPDDMLLACCIKLHP